MRLMFQALLVILVLSFTAFGKLTASRIGEYEDKRRVVLEFSQEVQYKAFTLENPKRLVIDISSDVEIPKIPPGVRVGKHAGFTRLVFEGTFSHVKVFSLHGPYRIVVDLYKPTDSQPHDVSEDDEILAIIEPSIVRILRQETKKAEQPKVVSEVSRSRVVSQRRLVVLDPGHGGHDPGAIGVNGLEEKDLVLTISKKLAELLKKDGRFKVVLTRESDVFIPLEERSKIALKNRADLFISIHADAAPERSPHARGSTIFAISSEAAMRKKHQIVRSDSYASLVLGNASFPAPARLALADLAMDVTLYEGYNFAKLTANTVRKKLSREVHFRGIKRAGFAVLKTPGIPSILVEVGFMTNPSEAALMAQEEFQEEFARALYQSIVQYFFPQKGVKKSPKSYAAEEAP
ncbi:MAG: N-acetylmuramoyl-L-alanine amidase [Aquificaceae bacterium]|nr:N-acetylmuramoyl-L-alanine amidase [Aquificaceae bacterium]MDW8236951.1 N-acetylmuramoyl-L-alanine amidase [Aquificaceae bacterium]